MADHEPKTATDDDNAVAARDIPGDAAAGVRGSASPAHPSDGIPLPEHGFDVLDEIDAIDEVEGPAVRDLATIPAVEIITRAAVMLMSASAEKLGLAPDGPQLDLDEARKLINALAGLLAASQDQLGLHRQHLRDGLRTLQNAFREASSYPDPPGEGPGEKWLR